MLALVAGRGGLPGRVAAAAGQDILVCALEGQGPDGLVPDLVFRLETLGSFLLQLGERGVSDVCFCGAIERPDIDPALLDAETAPLVPLLQEALSKGDDGALRVVLSLFEQTGFTIRAAHDVAPDIVISEGIKTVRTPRDIHDVDVRTAQQVLARMGAADIGQACVVRKGDTLAEEGPDGTDAMLASLALEGWTPPADLWDGDTLSMSGADWLRQLAGESFDAPGAGGLLYKAPKPDQDRRADLPTIGPGTALGAALAGLDGIVAEAGGVILLEPLRTLAVLDAMDMFLWARS